MRSVLEAGIEGFIGALGIGIIFIILTILFFFFSKIRDFIYEKVYKKPYWTAERKERASLEKEKIDLSNAKEKIAEKNTAEKMKQLGLDPKKDWQKYYQIRNEQIEKIEKRIIEITNRNIFLSDIIKKYKNKK